MRTRIEGRPELGGNEVLHLGAKIVCHYVEIVAGLGERSIVIVSAIDPVWAPGGTHRHLGAWELFVKQ